MGTLEERYALDRVIGRGASGSVWVAYDRRLRRPVAVKQLDRQFAEDVEACARFEREAWMIAQLRSPHIVQVFDLGVDAGVPFIVMEHLLGESLEDRLARYRGRSRLPRRIAMAIIAEVARGLTISHRAGIVHRDLKPGNVFLARENRREVTKLLDFGIAGMIADGGERAGRGMLAGTPQFMSPEHFDGNTLDGRADVWSLAVMAYEMLTGQLPFLGGTLRELREQIRAGSFSPPSDLVPELDRAVDHVFARAFARAVQDRFPTAGEFAIALDQAAGDRSGFPVARVLFVDDEEDMEALLRQRLRKEVGLGRYELLFARSEDEALELLATRPDIDVVFADINMPTKSATALLEHERKIGREGLSFLAQVPEVSPIVRVVMLSAHYDNRDYVRTAMNHGAFDFLGKPIDFGDLRHTIEKCASETRALRQLLESHQENELLRGLIGRSSADRLVAEVRAADATQAATIQGSVVFLGFPETGMDGGPSGCAQAHFSRLNAHVDLSVPEVHGRQGLVHAFWGDSMVAIFRGRDHLTRAVESCLAIVERARVSNALGLPETPEFSVTAGLGSGGIFEGRLGSTAAGRIEYSLLGGPVAVAAELKGVARSMEILVSTTVARELMPHFRCEPDTTRLAGDGSSVHRVVGASQQAEATSEAPPTESRSTLSLSEDQGVAS